MTEYNFRIDYKLSGFSFTDNQLEIREVPQKSSEPNTAGDKADPANLEAERALGIFISDIPMAPKEQIS